jgi:hypothetical protein
MNLLNFIFLDSNTSLDSINYIPLISPLVVILIFIFDRKLAYNLRKKELERTWYYKVLLEPNLSQINDFFKDISTNIKASFITLDKLDFDEDRSNYIKTQLLQIEIFKKIKREFELDVLQPIYSKYNKVNINILLEMESIENNYTKVIGESFLKNFDENAFMESVYSSKVKLLDSLYKPLN